MTQMERKVLDMQSSTLHRAAAHGDHSVLEAMVNQPDVDIGETDLKMRTALHVAAYRGKHRALALLVAKAAPEELALRDHTNRTAFEILREFHSKTIEQSAGAANDLREQCEVEHDMHKLAAAHYDRLAAWFFFAPTTGILTLCAILSFMASAEQYSEDFMSRAATGVGVLGFMCIFLVALNEQLDWGVAAEMHGSAEKDLFDLVEELDFNSVEEYVSDVMDGSGGSGRANAALTKKKLMQVKACCKAPLPEPLTSLFYTLQSRLDHELERVLYLEK